MCHIRTCKLKVFKTDAENIILISKLKHNHAKTYANQLSNSVKKAIDERTSKIMYLEL